MPGLARAARVLLAALLLAAQQAALEHALWHAGAAQAATDQVQKSDTGHNPLCDQHAALGAVAGAIGCAPVVLALAAPEYAAVAALELPARDNAPLSPSSRGPPQLL
jgi:hypothetical protein